MTIEKFKKRLQIIHTRQNNTTLLVVIATTLLITPSAMATNQAYAWPGFIKDIGGAIGDAAGAVGGAIGDAAGAVGGAIGDAAGAVGGAIGDAAGAVGGAIVDAAEWTGGAIVDAVTDPLDKIPVINIIPELVEDIFKKDQKDVCKETRNISNDPLQIYLGEISCESIKIAVEKIVEDSVMPSYSELYWTGDKVIISGSNPSENTVHVDLDLKYDVPVIPDPVVDVDGDLILSCDQTTKKIKMKATNFRLDADLPFYAEAATAGILETIEDSLVDSINKDLSSVEFSKELSTGLDFCPTLNITPEGNILVYKMTSISDNPERSPIDVCKETRNISNDPLQIYLGEISCESIKIAVEKIVEDSVMPSYPDLEWGNDRIIITDSSPNEQLISVGLDLKYVLREYGLELSANVSFDLASFCEKNIQVAQIQIVARNFQADIKVPVDVESLSPLLREIVETVEADVEEIINNELATLEFSEEIGIGLDFCPAIKVTPEGYIQGYTSQIDWNDNGKGGSDEGDPLTFSMTEKPVNIIRNWSEQHKSFLTEFDLYDTGETVTLSRTLDEGTMTLFLDLNGDGKLSDGTEWLYDQNENVYQILSRPLIDSNQNGWFDYSDDLWSIAMIKDGEKNYTASELGIVAFNWSDHSNGYGDMFGENRQYANCLYEGIYHYPDCKAVNENNFPIIAYNQNSILLNDGKILDSFGIVIGHLDMSKSNTSNQTQ